MMRLRLREMCKRKFLTQQQLANAIGATKANISRLENGEQEPRPSTILRLAAALGVSPEDLVEWVPEDEGKAAA